MPKSPRIRVRATVMLLAASLAAGLPAAGLDAGRRDRREQARRGGKSPPGRSVTAVGVSDATEVVPPFVLRHDPTAAGGRAIALPEGTGTAKLEGRASFPFRIDKPGVYHAWVHARWRDSCGNSVTLRIDDRPGYMTGQDRIYRTWHWVRAGRHQLDEGDHTATVGEREDGVAIDQVLFTADRDFRPTGTIGGRGSELRRFHDDFARSPGHGMDAWDLASGKWEIVFSFDPNQIPNQYSLHGRPEGSQAVALLRDAPARSGEGS
jgi:hypothetical protein